MKDYFLLVACFLSFIGNVYLYSVGKLVYSNILALAAMLLFIPHINDTKRQLLGSMVILMGILIGSYIVGGLFLCVIIGFIITLVLWKKLQKIK